MLSEFKANPVVKKIPNYRNKWLQGIRRMDRGRLPHLITKYQLCGKGSQERSLKNFKAVNGTGTGHEA